MRGGCLFAILNFYYVSRSDFHGHSTLINDCGSVVWRQSISPAKAPNLGQRCASATPRPDGWMLAALATAASLMSSSNFLRRDVYLAQPESFYDRVGNRVSPGQNVTDVAWIDTMTFCKRDRTALTFECRF
jgi:hypothetical protein